MVLLDTVNNYGVVFYLEVIFVVLAQFISVKYPA